jgi:hypothetical protein
VLLAGILACSGRVSTGEQVADGGPIDMGASGGSMAGGAGGGGAGGSAGAVTAEQACSDFAAAVCANIRRCGPAFFDFRYGDVATCVEREKIGCPSIFGVNGTNVTPQGLDACAGALATYACGDWSATWLPEACQPRGRLADGTVCGLDAQCSSGFCSKKEPHCGVCAPLLREGQDCGFGAACARDLVCRNGKCSGPLPSGVPCSGEFNHGCASGLVCLGGASGRGGVCAPPLPKGAPCDRNRVTGECDITIGLVCPWTTGVCTPIEFVDLGGSCGVLSENPFRLVYCKGGAICESRDAGVVGVCGPPRPDGAPCMPDDECRYPASCVDGVCTLMDPTTCR